MGYQIDNECVSELMGFIGSHPNAINYLHNTPTEQNAQKIIQNGLTFKSHIDYTADCINGEDEVEIKYFLNSRQNYGNYTVVIQIGFDLINKYTTLIHNSAIHYSEVLVKSMMYDKDDNESIYMLHPNFAKGYYDLENKITYLNPNFNPMIDLPLFQENFNRLKK